MDSLPWGNHHHKMLLSRKKIGMGFHNWPGAASSLVGFAGGNPSATTLQATGLCSNGPPQGAPSCQCWLSRSEQGSKIRCESVFVCSVTHHVHLFGTWRKAHKLFVTNRGVRVEADTPFNSLPLVSGFLELAMHLLVAIPAALRHLSVRSVGIKSCN